MLLAHIKQQVIDMGMPKTLTLLVVGIDNAGKTTLLNSPRSRSNRRRPPGEPHKCFDSCWPLLRFKKRRS